MKLTLELTNEQIVTNILISNDFLKPVSNCVSQTVAEKSLGDYIAEAEEYRKELNKNSKYSFINLDSGWGF